MSSTPTTIFYLEMTEMASFRAASPSGIAATQVAPPDPHVNKQMYIDVGTTWDWTDRLVWSDLDWRHYAEDPGIETWLGIVAGARAGYYELERQPLGDVQIRYFGLLPEFIGQGHGGALLSAAIERAWNLGGTRRVWLHTCTQDHPHALDNYTKRGLRVYRSATDDNGPCST